MLRLGAGYADPVRSPNFSTHAGGAAGKRDNCRLLRKSLVSERESSARVRYWPSHELFRNSGQNGRLHLELD